MVICHDDDTFFTNKVEIEYDEGGVGRNWSSLCLSKGLLVRHCPVTQGNCWQVRQVGRICRWSAEEMQRAVGCCMNKHVFWPMASREVVRLDLLRFVGKSRSSHRFWLSFKINYPEVIDQHSGNSCLFHSKSGWDFHMCFERRNSMPRAFLCWNLGAQGNKSRAAGSEKFAAGNCSFHMLSLRLVLQNLTRRLKPFIPFGQLPASHWTSFFGCCQPAFGEIGSAIISARSDLAKGIRCMQQVGSCGCGCGRESWAWEIQVLELP